MMKKKILFLMSALLIIEIVAGVGFGGGQGVPTVSAATSTQVLFNSSNVDGTSQLSSSMASQNRNVSVAAVTYGQVLEQFPTNSAVGVSIDTSLTITFDGIMTPRSGSINVSPGPTNDSRAIEIPVGKASINSNSSMNRTTVTFPLPSKLLYDTTYTVTVPEGAFREITYNNLSQGIYGSSWTFRTVSATVSSGSVSVYNQSPYNGATSVGINSEMVINFNSEVAFRNNVYNGRIMLKSAGGSSVAISTPIISGKQVSFKPISALTANTSYYVEIASDTLVDKYNPNILFSGFSGSGYWEFRTVSIDKTIPVLQSAQMYNNTTIRLVYDEILNESRFPYASNFTATVNNENRRVSSTYVIGESVYVVLEIGVAVGQNVQLSYSASSGDLIQDYSSNKAVAFSNKAVTNSIDSVLPKPKEGTIYGTTLSLLFNESLKSPSTNAYEQFTVTANGNSIGVSSIRQSGSMLYLTLRNSVSDGDVVRVTYRSGSYPIQDYRGHNISEFTDYYVRNSYDTKPPVFMGAEGSGNKINLKYNELLKTSNVPAKNQYSVLVNNAPIYVTAIQIVDDYVQLTLASAMSAGQTVTISYVPGVDSASRITDLNNNAATYINLEPVKLTPSTLIPEVKSATVSGDTITLQFSKNVTTTMTSAWLNTVFLVRVDNSIMTIQSTVLSGDTVTIRISSVVKSGQKVQLSYNSGSSSIKDSLGVNIPSFSGLDVQNLATKVDVTSGEYGRLDESQFGELMYVLPVSAATTSEGKSRFNQNVRKYLIDSSQLVNAYTYMKTTSNGATIVYEVPSYEKAAYVGIPLQSLQDVYRKDENAKIAVKSGESIYILPLSSLNIIEINRSLTSATSLVTIWIQVENVPFSSSSEIVTKVSQSGGQIIIDATDFYVSAVNNSTNKTIPLVLRNENVIRTTKSVSTNTTSFIYHDKSVGEISFVPTVTRKIGAYTVLRAKVKGNYTVAGITASTKFFGDLNNHWAKDAVNELVSKNIMDGRTSIAFEPNKNITRGEFAVSIAKALGIPSDAQTSVVFSDIQKYSATGSYIVAATEAGIIKGFTDKTFKPNSFITREQMAIMMVRAMDYAGYKTMNTTSLTETLSRFKDRSQIQSLESVSRAVKEGIIQGVSSTSFQPKGNATRAQAAVMVKRLLNTIGYL